MQLMLSALELYKCVCVCGGGGGGGGGGDTGVAPSGHSL